jgi:hypothetical protein
MTISVERLPTALDRHANRPAPPALHRPSSGLSCGRTDPATVSSTVTRTAIQKTTSQDRFQFNDFITAYRKDGYRRLCCHIIPQD